MTEITSPAEGLGDVIEQIRLLVENYSKAELLAFEDPEGVAGFAYRNKGIILPIPDEVFQPYRTKPARLNGTAELTSIKSLIQHVNRFKDSSSALFARDDRSAPSITAVYDYHHATSLVGESSGGAAFVPVFVDDRNDCARFGMHRASYCFPLSDEWERWVGASGKVFTMTEFAQFIEDNIGDVVDMGDAPALEGDLGRYIGIITGGTGKIGSPTTLVNLSKNLVINEESTIGEGVNLQSGEQAIQFVSRHTDGAGGPVRVPALFVIAIPIFANGALYQIAARLRYRKQNGRPVFFYELWRIDRAFDHAFSEACAQVEEETGLPLMLGTPE